MANAHESLELGIIPQEHIQRIASKDCKNTEDVCSESTPMNTPAINEDYPQPVATENMQPDSNPTNSLHSEQGNMIFGTDLLYICCLK